MASFLLFYQQSTSLFSLSVFYWLSTNFYCSKLKISVRLRRARLDSRSVHSQRFTRVQSDCCDPARERDKLHLSVSLSSSLSLFHTHMHARTERGRERKGERERRRKSPSALLGDRPVILGLGEDTDHLTVSFLSTP